MAFPVNNDVEWDRCETHQLYRNQSAAFGMDHLDTRGGDWELDKISSTTVARINLRRVATTRASVLGEWGLAIDMLHGVLSVPLQPDWESVVAEAKLSVPPADAFGGPHSRFGAFVAARHERDLQLLRPVRGSEEGEPPQGHL